MSGILATHIFFINIIYNLLIVEICGIVNLSKFNFILIFNKEGSIMKKDAKYNMNIEPRLPYCFWFKCLIKLLYNVY